MKFSVKSVSLCLALLSGLGARADVAHQVHLVQQVEADGEIVETIDLMPYTGDGFTTSNAAARAGFIFTHWSTSAVQDFASRDPWGRVYEQVAFSLYETTTNTAHYVRADLDADGDGLADGLELYWYGTLDPTPTCDTDGDGVGFARELELGTNPHFPDSYGRGVTGASAKPQFFRLVLRSEPEGALFATVTNSVAPGVAVRTDAYGPATSDFAHWTVAGADVATRDAFGRALDWLSFAMPTNDVELVAVCRSDASARQSLYWYGNETTDGTSDTDGDGLTFAEEVRQGTNPLFADAFARGVVPQTTGIDLFSCVVRSEPEGTLFETIVHNVGPGVLLASPTADPRTSAFAGWYLNGARQADAFGRALDAVSFAMPTNDVELVAFTTNAPSAQAALYWYGVAEMDGESDTDGDGLTFAEEARQGTNPLFADAFARGVVFALGEELEADLQPFEQMRGAIVGGEYKELFTSGLAGNAATSATFGENACPLAVDVDGDGLFDLVVVSRGELRLFLNRGSAANPDFVPAQPSDAWANFRLLLRDMVRPLVCAAGGVYYVSDGGGPVYAFTLADGTVSDTGLAGVPAVLDGRLVALTAAGTLVADGLTVTLDTPVIGGVSLSAADVDADGRTDVLVSDTVGHIWLYRNVTTTGEAQAGAWKFKLLHKVWAGTGVGFAEGMTISLVDWDDDGDQDVLIGTPEGKLMLLRDPRTGRPTNVRAIAGADNVLLTWDPNSQPRIRGYNVYRAPDAESYQRIVSQTPLPTWRDRPGVLRDYWYRVTGVSRFYIAGNSTPTVHESLPTDAVYVQFRPRVWLTDTSGFTESNVTVVVSMNNSMGISAEGLTLAFAYDPAVLEPRGMRTTGLTDGVRFEEKKLEAEGGGGAWTFSSLGGTVATGAGRFLLLDFRIRHVHDITETTVALTAATVKALDGRAVALDLPQTAKIEISDSNPLVPALVAVRVADASVASETAFDLPVAVTSSETLTNFTAEVAWDAALLELRGVAGATLSGGGRNGMASVRGTGGDFALNFYAKDPASAATNFSARVSLTNIVAVDVHGFVVGADDAAGTVLIRNAHPWVPATVTISTESRRVDTLATVTVPFAVASDGALASGRFVVEWDTAALELRGGAEETDAGRAEVDATGDFALTFRACDQHTISQTLVRLTSAEVTDAHGFVVRPTVPVVSTILIRDAHPLVPAEVALALGDVAVPTEAAFAMALAVSSTETLTNLVLELSWDAALLDLREAVGARLLPGAAAGTATLVSDDGADIALRFYAKENHTVGTTEVTARPLSGWDRNGLAAVLSEAAVGRVVLADSNPWVPATVRANVGGARVDTLTAFEVPVTFASSERLTNLVATVAWDADVLELRGIAGGAARVGEAADGTARLAGDGGNFTLTFYAKDQHAVTRTDVRLSGVTVVDEHGFSVGVEDAQGVVLIRDSNPLVPAEVAVRVADASVASETAFELPVAVTSSETLTNFTAEVTWDAALLELRGVVGATLAGDGASGTASIRGAGGDFALNFYAKDPASAATNFSARVSLMNIVAVDAHGFVVGADDAAGTVLIRNAHPWVPATVWANMGGARVDTLTAFEVPVTFASSERLTNLVATVAWDADVLELRGVAGGAARVGEAAVGTAQLAGDGGNFTLKFYAKDQHTVTRTEVRLSGVTVVDAHGFTVDVEDASGTVLIRDANPLVPASVILNVAPAFSDTLRAFAVAIPVTSTKTLTNLAFTVGWDADVLELRGASGGAFIDGAVGNGSARIGARGMVPSTLALTFYAKDQHTVTETAVTLGAASAVCLDGLAAKVTTVDGTVRLTDANPPVPVELTVATYHARVASGEAFKVPVGATASGDLAELTVDVDWDDTLLTFNGSAAATRVETLAANRRRLVFACEGNDSLFNLDFTAARIAGLQTNAWTRVVAASGVGRNGLAAVLKTALPRTGDVVIVREIGRYDPGDLDGDGAYTDRDQLILVGYVTYLKLQKRGAAGANAYADGYLKDYGVDVRLTGAAARAADVNGDGQVDSHDIAMLEMLIAEAKGAGK